MATLQERMALAKQHYEHVHQKKLKNTEMAEYCKVSKVSIGQWFNGPTKNLDGTNLSRAAEFLGVNHKWLAGRSAPMIEKAPDPWENDPWGSHLVKESLLRVPVFKIAKVDKFDDPESYTERFTFTHTDYLSFETDSVFAVEVEDSSMQPEFYIGDELIIDTSINPKPGSYVIANVIGGENFFRKYRVTGYDEDNNERFELIPLNPDFPTLNSTQHKLSIIGVVARLRRNYM